MKRLLLLAMLSTACGDRHCSDVFGQDCGAGVTVTLLYLTREAPGAGDAFGGIDGGFCPPIQDGGPPQCRCSSCTVSHTVSLAQYEYAVRQSIGCPEVWTSGSTVTLDCVKSCDVVVTPPAGASNGACIWSPPLLSP
jgi:hypothetical protein